MHKDSLGTGSTHTEYGTGLGDRIKKQLIYSEEAWLFIFTVIGYIVRVFLVVGNWLKVVSHTNFAECFKVLFMIFRGLNKKWRKRSFTCSVK